MIPMPSGVRVWIATGHTDMRRGMQGLALQVQEQLKRDPHGGDLYIFRGRRGDLAKILWHDGVGLSLYAKRLDRGKFIWPSAKGGVVSISAGADGLHAGRNRLAESATDVAAEERGLSATTEAPAKRRKTWDHTHFRAPQITRICDSLRRMDPAPEAASRRRRRPESGADRRARAAPGSRGGTGGRASESVGRHGADRRAEARIAKLERQVYGQRSERSARLIDQLALEFEELEASATEDELAAEQAAAKTTTVRPFTRRRAERDTFPDHLPRERVVIDPPTACACCGGNRLRKLGEDVTQTLETTPRRWKVIETVREKFSCRDCETISQAPAPFHVIPRAGRARACWR